MGSGLIFILLSYFAAQWWVLLANIVTLMFICVSQTNTLPYNKPEEAFDLLDNKKDGIIDKDEFVRLIFKWTTLLS